MARGIHPAVVAAVVCAVFGGGCRPSQSSVSAGGPASRPAAAMHQGPGRVHDGEHGFSIVPPAGYARCEKPQPHFMMFLGPQEGQFTVNFNVSSRADDTPLEQFGARARALLPWALPEFAVVEEGFGAVGPRQCYWMSATFRWDGQPVRNLQYYFRGGNGHVYVVTFAAPADTFAQHRATFETAAQTARAD